MSKSPEPMPGAIPFDGMANMPRRFEPTRRRAFGSMPRLLGVDLELHMDLSTTDFDRVESDYITESLYTDKGRSVNGLALNPQEYGVLFRSQQTFENAIVARASTPHALSHPLRHDEVKLTAPLHAYQDDGGLLEKHQLAVHGFTDEVTNLNELRGYIKARGFAHTTEARLRQVATYAWEKTFTNILYVLGDQRRLEPRDRHANAEAMATKLFAGAQSERVAYWGVMSTLAERYTNAKRLLFTQRQHVIESRIDVLTKERDQFYATHGLDPID